MADYCCMNMGVKTAMKKLNAAGPDAVVCMSCGDGVQVAAAHSPSAPVYPSNNTMFLGEAVRFGLFEEACHLCGDCVLGTTGGICPISQLCKVSGKRPLRRSEERQVRGESGQRLCMDYDLQASGVSGKTGSPDKEKTGQGIREGVLSENN